MSMHINREYLIFSRNDCERRLIILLFAIMQVRVLKFLLFHYVIQLEKDVIEDLTKKLKILDQDRAHTCFSKIVLV